MLLHFRSKHPFGVATTHRDHGDAPPGAWSMVVVRGLERRGYVNEKTWGLFYLTDLGMAVADRLAATASTDSDRSKP